MASTSGCRVCSHAGPFSSEGHGRSPRDRFDRGLSVDAAPDGCERFDESATMFSVGCDANSHKKAPSNAIIRGYSSNEGSHDSGRFNAENSNDLNRPAFFASSDFLHRKMQNGFDELPIGTRTSFNRIVADSWGLALNTCNGEPQLAHATSEFKGNKPPKRAFCKICEKAQDLCICGRFKSVVPNKIKITILQNPKEKQHAVGSVRVAMLGLENVDLVDVPEILTNESFRIRPKVPGSKRSLAGRGGKKLLLNGGKAPAAFQDKMVPSEVEVLQIKNLLMNIFKCDVNYCSEIMGPSRWSLQPSKGGHELLDGSMHIPRLLVDGRANMVGGNVRCDVCLEEGCTNPSNESLYIKELESLIPPGVALLYPSDKAVELPLKFVNNNNEEELKAPCHLLVLDGTWSKARRIYFENPWLHDLPHYKLSLPSPSLYEGVRKQPKPGCLSTLESIVYALKVLEPENEEGLDGLLEVFDSMVEDQRRCKEMRGNVQDRKT